MNLRLLRKVIASFLRGVDFSGEVASDIVEIKEALEPLVSHYQDIISYIPANVYWFDQNCIAMGCNQNVLDMLCLKSIAEFRGLTFESMAALGDWSAEITQSFKQDTLDVIKTGKAKLSVEEPPIPHAEDGRLIYFLSNRVPLFDKNKNIIGAVGISVDITEQKKTQKMLALAKEAAEEANFLKTQFIEDVSHELRTPLAGILGMAEVLNYSPRLNAEDKEKLSSIQSSGQLLLKLTNDILNFSKIESDKVALQFSEVDFDNWIKGIVASFLPLGNQKNLILDTYYSESCPTHIIIDPFCVRQVLTNLIDNAIKFTETGKIIVFVDLISREGEKLILQISVKDTGVGISADQLNHIFERFYQINPSYMSVSSGVGLGLAIVKELLSKMGGAIQVDSQVGRGSTFCFALPCTIKLKAESEVGPQKCSQNVKNRELINSEKNKQPFHILLVEDNPINQKIIIHMLSLLFNCDITVAKTGAETIEMFSKYFDLVLLDIGLPDISGFEVAEALNNRMTAENFSVPVVSITAHADITDAHPLYKELKFSGALIKPVQMQDLKELISKVLIK